ncbi:uncharacterized protein LOC100837809 [Brachypodium distachyon]|nr:uncharacterized protein LOC100837809 [Brachypodium distachyon]|eukprot:XP_024310313.1 uncharacterized protein LOC100837809 [Brachypodium distachyon]
MVTHGPPFPGSANTSSSLNRHFISNPTANRQQQWKGRRRQLYDSLSPAARSAHPHAHIWLYSGRWQINVPEPLPLLALPNGTFYSLPCTKNFHFPGCGFAGFKSACGSWLVFPRDDGCFLVNPLSRATVTLPALSSVRICPPDADLSQVPVDPPVFTWLHIKDKTLDLRKLMMCSPNLVAAFVNHHGVGQILVCQPWASSWSVQANDTCKGFVDMALYQGKLYTLSHHEHLCVVNISQDETTWDPQVFRNEQVIKGDTFSILMEEKRTGVTKKLYLVESRGVLLMVCREVCCTWVLDKLVAGRNKFEVFEADFKRSRWVNVMTLGDDQVLFLGQRCSKAVPVSQYEMTGDRIFFFDDDEYYDRYTYEGENASIGVYDMKDQEVSILSTVSWKRDGMRLATWLFPQD